MKLCITRYLSIACLVASYVLFSPFVLAEVLVDIRSAAPIASRVDQVDYVARISECGSLAYIKAGSSSNLIEFTAQQTSPVVGKLSACEIQFSLYGGERYAPTVELSFLNGDVKNHSEIYFDEFDSPNLSFNNVSFVDKNDQQYLVINVSADDNSDIAYIGFEALGLRAYKLRLVGGVLESAKKDAFANTGGSIRVYPDEEGQSEFTYAIPVTQALSAEAIAHDALVILDLIAVDSSGNHSTYSKIAFTGTDVAEEIYSLTTMPDNIILSNSLETVSIVPTVDFQFRGPTSLAGENNLVSYSSTNTSVVAVTAGGVVYPVAESSGQTASILVSYPGLDTVEIPVTVDYTKFLTGLVVNGVDGSNPLVLDSLNTFYSLPQVMGQFNDESTSVLSDRLKVALSVSPESASILEINESNEIKSKAILTSDSPVLLTVYLTAKPEIQVMIPVISTDAIPSVSLSVPTSVKVGTDLELVVDASDDVGIANITYWMNGAVIGRDKEAPYQLILPISPEMNGEPLTFYAVAMDTAGKTALSQEYSVIVTPAESTFVASVKFTKPIDLERYVEKSDFLFEVSYSLGIIPNTQNSSDISYIEFFMDGRQVGAANYPNYKLVDKIIDNQRKKELFEIWELSTQLPGISTAETTLGISATVYGRNGASKEVPGKIIKIVKNRQPQIQMSNPVSGDPVTVGQTLKFEATVVDDTLPLGTTITFYLDDREVHSALYVDEESKFDGHYDLKSTTFTFDYPIDEEMLGRTLQVKASVADFHGSVADTELISVPVRGDQPPTVAIS